MYARKHYILLLFVLVAFFSCQEKKADFFVREAKEYTEKNCPQRLDALTTLDSMVYVKDDGAGDLVQYYSMTLTDEQRQEMMNKLTELGEMNLSIIRNSVLLAKHKEYGTSFTYIYRDANKGDKIVEYHFTAKDYQ